jgi:hypothetical protein
MNNVKTGKCLYSWVDYSDGAGENASLQIIEWPNGAGFSIVKGNDKSIDFEWEEWAAIEEGIFSLKSNM